MQGAGQLELAQILHIQSQRTDGETDFLGDMDQLVELGILERRRETAAQRHKAGADTMHMSQHRKLHMAAFSGPGLQNHSHTHAFRQSNQQSSPDQLSRCQLE